MGAPKKNLVLAVDREICDYCGEKRQYICSRCHSCENCEECRAGNGEITGSGWYHVASFKGTELVATVRDHKSRGVPKKSAQRPPT